MSCKAHSDYYSVTGSIVTHLYSYGRSLRFSSPRCAVHTPTICREAEWRCTVAMSAGCSVHQLIGCECNRNRSYAPFRRQNSAYMGIYGHIQPYIQLFTCIYKLQTYICSILHILACLLYLNASIYADIWLINCILCNSLYRGVVGTCYCGNLGHTCTILQALCL